MKTKKYTAIIDLGLSNLHNVKLACEIVGIKNVVTSNPVIISKANALILPGVGSFKEAMKRINLLKLEKIIKKSIHQKKPFLGICLGMQLLFSRSNEFGKSKGLKILKGEINRLKYSESKYEKYSIPHTGWNKINFLRNKRKFKMLSGLKNSEFMYFVHSFYVKTREKNYIKSVSEYGQNKFPSIIIKNNICACQFHPEKSGKSGLKIYKNFKGLIK